MQDWKQISESVTITPSAYKHRTPKWKEFLIKLFKGEEYLKRREAILSKKHSPLRVFTLRAITIHKRMNMVFNRSEFPKS